jgi:hypothetical protein
MWSGETGRSGQVRLGDDVAGAESSKGDSGGELELPTGSRDQ